MKAHPTPNASADRAGWYDVDDGRVLLTYAPAALAGKPLALVAEGDRVWRGEPIDESRVRLPDGRVMELGPANRATDLHEEELSFVANDIRLAATVLIPHGPGPHPASVMVHGAAGGERDFYRLFARPFLEAGVAVLLYDKQGFGASGGSAPPTIFDQAAAARAGLDALSERSDIDSGRLGLSGFSNGMWSVPMVAAERPNLAFVVGIGSPGVTMSESEVHRRVKVLRDEGIGAAVLEQVEIAWRAIFSIAAAGEATPEAARSLAAAQQLLARDPVVQAYVPALYAQQEPMLSPVPPALSTDDLVATLDGATPELIHDPVTDYASIQCPVFLQFGEHDTSVPVDVSVERITAALEHAGNKDVTIRVYPGLEHMLNIPRAVDGHSVEDSSYQFLDFDFGKGVWSDLQTFLTYASVS